ncbi:response regulator [candidate division WOR-3 bacterium]|nr:response regulator [candidate division WOR-3 bacterium]
MARILLVEDEANLRELVLGRLEQWGHQVETASDGFNAVAKARAFHPELIILDLMIPRMDGYTVCRLLKSSGMAETPIIIFSARSSPDDVRRGTDMGADGYVTKPFEPEVLQAKIDALLQPRQPAAAPAPEPAAPEAKPA